VTEEEPIGTLRFRPDLYRGTAPYYDSYRPPYPEALFADLRQRQPLSASARVLDLGCGTGQVAVPLALHAADVVAVDQEAESVEFGRAKTEAAGLTNITWLAGSAETVVVDGPFELVTVGNAFQRLDRSLVAQRMMCWLAPGGGVALLWGDSPWHGDQPWQGALEELFVEWMAKAGATDRVPAGWESAMQQDPHEQVLRRAGFEYLGKFEFVAEQAWTPETLAGFVYSTSFLSLDVLGERSDEFARDLEERVKPYAAHGTVRHTASYAYELARTPPS
jgi:SAM-dependent methyltransferase